MLVVTTLGGNALLQRGEAVTPENQRRNVRLAAKALAPVALHHRLVIGAQADGTIGCLIEQELGSLLPLDRPFACLLTMVEVDPADPAFQNPTTLVGPACTPEEADRLAADKGWVFKRDGDKRRRVIASPEPKRIFELKPMKWLLDHNTVVIAAGGGMLAMYERGKQRTAMGVECAIDKDLAAALLARELGADLFVMLTDAPAVFAAWGTPAQRQIRGAPPAALSTMPFAAGSMGPKVAAACRFVTATGKRAVIGSLADMGNIIAGDAGTTISAKEPGVVYA